MVRLALTVSNGTLLACRCKYRNCPVNVPDGGVCCAILFFVFKQPVPSTIKRGTRNNKFLFIIVSTWIKPETLQRLYFFCFVPKYIHFGKAHIMQIFPLLFRLALKVLETLYKFTVCFFKRILRIDINETCVVDQRK